jgi:hypothetical protein
LGEALAVVKEIKDSKPWIIAAHALPMALLDAHRCRLYLSGPKERHHYQ